MAAKEFFLVQQLRELEGSWFRPDLHVELEDKAGKYRTSGGICDHWKVAGGKLIVLTRLYSGAPLYKIKCNVVNSSLRSVLPGGKVKGEYFLILKNYKKKHWNGR